MQYIKCLEKRIIESTIHADVLGGSNGYLHNKNEMFVRIKQYIEDYKK